MKTSSLIRSIACEIEAELLTNTTARPNYIARERLNRLNQELKSISGHAAATTEHLLHLADHYYGDSRCEKLSIADKHLHSEMLSVAGRLGSVADHYAARGD